ncbi:MAG: hypothetical protein MI754_18430 [Chromatiales bacterium]|nr:hypothetical protein [Chromatiales bacterium]
MDSDYFVGPERIEIFEPSNTPMRMGDPSELAVSNYQRVCDAIEVKDFETAYQYLELQFASMKTMIVIFSQWFCAYQCAAEKLLNHDNALLATDLAYQHWTENVRSISETGSLEHKVVGNVALLLDPNKLTPQLAQAVIEGLNEGQISTFLSDALEMYELYKSRLLDSLDSGKQATVHTRYHEYFICARTWHDALMQYTDSFPTVAAIQFGQLVAEQLVDQSFKIAPFSHALWQFGSTLSQKQLAAFLLEHLRDHYSGPNREGTALLIEHEDRYQLIFDPCGSGGAMRRRLGARQYRLSSASSATFGKKNEVPPYCAHCAFNTITSIERFGWPIYVTEFNEDPQKPCGWTIYKNPEDIPDFYFENVGYKKDPRKFIRRS